MTIALVPVKRLADSKSRLLSQLADAGRQALTLAMLEDLIDALHETRGVDRIVVTTPDPAVARAAEAAGAEILLQPAPGLNAALEDGVARLVPEGGDDLLIVLGDVAGALAADFEQLIEAARASDGPGVWLAPSSDGGSSALLQHPGGVLPCCFGRDSAKRHRAAAERAGVPFHELPLASLAIDLDQPEDLEAFRATRGGGARTRALLDSVLPPRARSTEPGGEA